jgi:DNA-binding beta-propeller fold protein YncE
VADHRVRALLPLLVPALACVAGDDPPAAPAETLPVLERTIPLPGVAGRIDHLALSPDGKHLAVAALGNGTVEVVGLDEGRVVRTIGKIPTPCGVVYLPKPPRLAVTAAGDGTLRLFDAAKYEPAGKVAVGDDADNLRLDAATGRLYAGAENGAIAIVEDGRKVGAIRIDAHPESFQLDEGSDRIFVNVPGARHVAVLDRKTGKVLATWPIAAARGNYPMALAAARKRLLVGCRRPARLLVLDSTDGRVAGDVEISGDADDVFFDGKANRIYVACGEGFVDVLTADEAKGYARLGRVKSARGARTCLFDPKGRRLYVAAPRRDGKDAAVLVFRTR